jgi:hypothetical protein
MIRSRRRGLTGKRGMYAFPAMVAGKVANVACVVLMIDHPSWGEQRGGSHLLFSYCPSILISFAAAMVNVDLRLYYNKIT